MTDDIVAKLRLICKCGTIYEVCNLPMDIFEVVKSVNTAKCPTCSKGGKTAAVYVEKKNER